MKARPLSPSIPSGRGMDKYEQLAVVGEGSYGVVLKCRRRDTGQFVAIKKFLETEDDAAVRKMALREIRMLKKLRHDHLVNMIEVFRRKRRFYLVFEYLDRTLLDELEGSPAGLGEEPTKKYLYQLLKGIDYCHQNSIIHRDVKPENVLVSNDGIVKLCDFGFARTLAAPGEPCTEYVATRWYRAPELLVAEHRYGTEVDIWAVGCLFAEMLTGEPLFPGDSDIDQLALIVKTVGKLAPRHQLVVSKLPGSAAAAQKPLAGRESLPATGTAKDLMAVCLRTEPRARPAAAALLRHKYFLADNFIQNFSGELRRILGKESKIPSGPAKSATKVGAKPRQRVVNVYPDQNRSTEATAPTDLIGYNFNPSADNIDKDAKKGNQLKKLCPPTKTFNVPVNNFPRTPHIKKVKNKLIVDEDMKSRVPPPLSTHKVTKKAPPLPPPPADFTLPDVPGASHIPMKKAKKPMAPPFGSTGHESWDGAYGGADIPKTPINLPYM